MTPTLPSIEERVEELREHATQDFVTRFSKGKFSMPTVEEIDNWWIKMFETTLTTDRHAIGEMLLEWVGKNTQSINDEECWISDFVDAEDLETFIKSELMGKD